MSQLGVVILLWLQPLHLTGSSLSYIEPNGTAARYTEEQRLQGMIDALRLELRILEQVTVTVVDRNPLVMSVETRGGRSGPFTVLADEQFVGSLNDDELKAAIAHELGHVWIYTHHPYVQTEQLANEIALRVTSREVLEPVYEKVWKRTGIRGNSAEYLMVSPSQRPQQ